jgi:Flp pilus assembly protein TadD
MMLSRIILAALLCACGLWAQQPAPNSRLLQQAVALHQSGDLEGAIRAYREYLAVEPDSVEARSNLGVVLARTGRYPEAIAAYNRALATSPGNPALLLNLGLAYYKTGRPSEAASRFEQAAAVAPQFKEQVTMLLASCYNSLAKYKQAIDILAPLEKSGSEDAAFNYLYGAALIGDGQEAKGAVVIDRVLAKGDSAEARVLQGAVKLRQHDYDGARADLEKAIALNDKLPGAHAQLGELLLAKGELARSRDAFTAELAIDPADFKANSNLGLMAKEDQDYAAARRYFGRALESRPNDPGVRYQVALLDFATGHPDTARKALEALVAESPNFAEAHASLATVCYRAGDRTAGDRERAIAEKLKEQQDAAEGGVIPR